MFFSTWYVTSRSYSVSDKLATTQEIVSDIRFFDVGFFQGSNVVNIRNVEDLREAWSDIIKLASGSSKAVLWCDGLREEVIPLVRNVDTAMILMMI